MPCPTGTSFNPTVSVCDHSYNVAGCHPATKECHDATGKPITTDPVATSGGCQHYQQCVVGVLHENSCPADLAFNPSTLTCDYPYNVAGCVDDTCTIPPTKTECEDASGNPISTGATAVSGSCQDYCQCAAGYMSSGSCGKDEAFNPSTGLCDFPY